MEKLGPKNAGSLKNSLHPDNIYNRSQKMQNLFKNFNSSGFNQTYDKEKEPKVVFNNPIMSILNLNQSLATGNSGSSGNPNQWGNCGEFLNQMDGLASQFPKQAFQNIQGNHGDVMQSHGGNGKDGGLNERKHQSQLTNNLNNINEAIFQKNLTEYFNNYLKNNNINGENMDLPNMIANYIKERKIHQEFLLGQCKQYKGANYEKIEKVYSMNISQDKYTPNSQNLNDIKVRMTL
jgi:hypothetical protein